MRSDRDHQKFDFGCPIHDAEGKAFDKYGARRFGSRCAAHGMTTGSIQRRLNGRLESNTGALAGGRVVLDFVQQLFLGRGQKPKRSHLAMARALAKTSSAGIAATSPAS